MLRTPFGSRRRVSRSGIVARAEGGFLVRWKGVLQPTLYPDEREARAVLNGLHDSLLRNQPEPGE